MLDRDIERYIDLIGFITFPQSDDITETFNDNFNGYGTAIDNAINDYNMMMAWN